MQSSGVGNCINMLSLINTCRFPFLTLITMRGEWAEFNPWQVPMSQATEPVLTAMGVKCYRADRPEDVADTAQAAAELAFGGDFAVAVLPSQKGIGRQVGGEGVSSAAARAPPWWGDGPKARLVC